MLETGAKKTGKEDLMICEFLTPWTDKSVKFNGQWIVFAATGILPERNGTDACWMNVFFLPTVLPTEMRQIIYITKVRNDDRGIHASD